MTDEFKLATSCYGQPWMCRAFSEVKNCWDWCDLREGHDGEHHYRPATWRERHRRRRQLRREMWK